MFFPNSKVYFDGSHYIAIPHTERLTKRRTSAMEEPIILEDKNEEIEEGKSEENNLEKETAESGNATKTQKNDEKIAKNTQKNLIFCEYAFILNIFHERKWQEKIQGIWRKACPPPLNFCHFRGVCQKQPKRTKFLLPKVCQSCSCSKQKIEV